MISEKLKKNQIVNGERMNRTALFMGLMIALALAMPVMAAEDITCAVYFTGIGCPHCAKADPYVLGDLLLENPNLVIIEYEIYQHQTNGPVFLQTDTKYNTGLGIPLLVFGEDDTIAGDRPILDDASAEVSRHVGNKCPLPGGAISFEELDLNDLKGSPVIWARNHVVYPGSGEVDNKFLKEILLSGDIHKTLEGKDYIAVEPEIAKISGAEISFDEAIEISGWKVQWVGPCLNESVTIGDSEPTCETGVELQELTVAKILSLAAVDAVNPCALAVLTLMLISIITYNPEKKRNILLAGLAFALSVFVMYIFYGLVIIKFFQVVSALTNVRLLLYKILGAVAIILGVLNIKDFIKYTPGSLGTEMPMSLRPLAKKIISKVTSPRGAFVIGAFVTIFLLPCTIGPYIIAGGILSVLETLKTLPWLLIYNAIFVLPMLAITLLVYFGVRSVQNIATWKDQYIRYLHLIAGAIILLLGIAMLMGLV